MEVDPQPELLPCPFCGSKNARLMHWKWTNGLYQVLCGGCGSGSGKWIEPDLVIEGWNTRKLDDN